MKATYLSRSAKITALLCTVLLACLLTGCTVPVTERNLIAAALGPTAASFFTNSAQVQTDTAGAALPCYYDTASGTSYYVCEDLNKVSATEYGYTLRAFYFQNGVLRNRTLATRTVLYNASGQTFTSCRDYLLFEVNIRVVFQLLQGELLFGQRNGSCNSASCGNADARTDSHARADTDTGTGVLLWSGTGDHQESHQ